MGSTLDGDATMKVRQLPYIDWSSPGMIDPDRAERDDEGPLEDIDIDDDPER